MHEKSILAIILYDMNAFYNLSPLQFCSSTDSATIGSLNVYYYDFWMIEKSWIRHSFAAKASAYNHICTI